MGKSQYGPYRDQISLDRTEFLQVLQNERAVIDALRNEDCDQQALKVSPDIDEKAARGDAVGYIAAQWKLWRWHRKRRKEGRQEALRQEVRASAGNSGVPETLKRVPKTPYSALCLSGGGIRSATFNLGILQALARIKCLQSFDYLSTVSGGGFVGSWYSAWVHRAKTGQSNSPLDALGNNDQSPKWQSASDPFITREAEPVRHLRQYSNYLAPKVGLLSPDAWTLLTIYVRNLILTSVVFVPFLMAGLAAPRVIFALLQSNPQAFAAIGISPLMGVRFVLAAGIAMGIIGIGYAGIDLPAIRTRNGTRLDYRVWCLTPLVVSALLLNACWSWYVGFPDIVRQVIPQWLTLEKPSLSPGSISIFLLLPLVLIVPGWLYSSFRRRRAGRNFPRGTWVLATVLLVAGGLGGGWFMSLVALNPVWTSSMMFTTFSVPAVLTMMMVGATLMAGFTSRLTTDMDEEWWARSGAYLGIACFVWVLANGIVLWLPSEFLKLTAAVWSHSFGDAFYTNTGRSLAAAAGALSTVLSLWGGFSSKTPAQGSKSSSNGTMLLNVGATVALVFVLVVLAAASNIILVEVGPFLHQTINASWTDHAAVLESSGVVLPFVLMIGLVMASFGFGLLVDTNKYSLHYFWRNRIMRAYLGASRFKPPKAPGAPPTPIKKDTSVAFTDFDTADNIQMSDLAGQRPLHVINMALNLTGSKRLEWQERKAESFTVTPYYCGNYRLGYRPSRDYGGPRGISLATAVAISGAAVSPNMGFMMSSPIVRLLMTLFNVRLGWWLGNPGQEGDVTFFQAAPRHILRPLIAEAFGQTDEVAPYVYLSDGGHFENLGLYEMVLRRCRFIMASDASTDPEYEYDSLGQAVRKIRIDLQIPIEFTNWGSVSTPEGGLVAYWAAGRILYSRADQTSPQDDGDLLYIKPAMVMNEPLDVANYRRENPAFPQEPISDQFFSESQFESYRALGDHIVSELSARATTKDLPGLLGVAKDLQRSPVIGEQIVEELKQMRKAFAKAGSGE